MEVVQDPAATLECLQDVLVMSQVSSTTSWNAYRLSVLQTLMRNTVVWMLNFKNPVQGHCFGKWAKIKGQTAQNGGFVYP